MWPKNRVTVYGYLQKDFFDVNSKRLENSNQFSDKNKRRKTPYNYNDLFCKI